MLPEIRTISNEKELNTFLSVIINSFSTVAEQLKLTKETAPTNPAFITAERLLEIYNNIKCFGLYYENLPIGFFGLEESEDAMLMLEKLSVLPEYRHRGFGKMILDYTVQYASELGYKKISIAIINENSILKKWYGDYGFAETRINIFPHLPFEVCFMEFSINPGSN
jgi:GNAT superfamily N-acetyltransferase